MFNIKSNLILSSKRFTRSFTVFNSIKQESKPVKNIINEDQLIENLSFDEMIEYRRSQARRSILVSIVSNNKRENDDKTLTNCFTQLNEFLYKQLNCKMKQINHFKNLRYKRDYALIEFKSESDLNYILDNYCSHFRTTQIQTKTRILSYHNNNNNAFSKYSNVVIYLNQDLSLNMQKDDDIKTKFQKFKSIDEQIIYYSTVNRVNEFSLRLKFFVASLIEDTLKPLHPSVTCIPFGSTLNGFGRLNSDLDLSIDYKPILGNNYLSEKTIQQSIFYFESKKNSVHMNLDDIRKYLITFVPFFTSITFIRQARVPILKGDFSATDPSLQFDISNEVTRVYVMTRIIWSYVSINPIVVKPLVKLVKLWTQITQLSYKKNDIPVNLTSYQVSLLTLIFLMNKGYVPDLVELFKNYQEVMEEYQKERKNKTRMGFKPDEGINHEEIIGKLKFKDMIAFSSYKQKQTTKFFELFLEFLEFYANYDYTQKLILLKQENLIFESYNPTSNSIFVCNPLDPYLNACGSISKGKQFNRFKNATKNSLSVYKGSRKKCLFDLLKEVDTSKYVSNEQENDEDMIEDILNSMEKNA